MRRRALLTSLAVGTTALAGCATSLGDNETTTDDPNPSTDPSDPPDESPPDTVEWQGDASVVELETGPRTYAFSPTTNSTDDGGRVSLRFDRTATADHPARLRGSFENQNEFENTFRVERLPAVGDVHSQTPRGYTHEARLHLAPTKNNDLAETVPEVARAEGGYWRVADVGPWMTETVRLEPGERVDLEYVVVGEADSPGRPTGTYRFGGDHGPQIAVWDTDNPGPDEQSRFEGRSLPAFGSETTVGWYHDANGTTAAFLRPSTERIELDGLVTFEMVNHSREALTCGHWDLYKLVDEQWFHVAPTVHTSDCRSLGAGETMEWSLRAFNDDSVPCEGCGCGDGLTRGYLGGGEYAVVAGYGHPADESAALIELVGAPVTLAPTDDASHEREGDTVTVTTDSYGDEEHPPDATFELTRTDTADERVIAEQVMAADGFARSGRGLRNVLAVLEPDVDRVVLRSDEHAVRDIDSAGETQRIRFRGQAYEITRQ